jgi:oligoribonuclease
VATDPNRLIWLDLEMTGLVPESDRIIEIALLATDPELNQLDDGLVLVVRQPDEVLAGMDSWNTSVHGRSGLIDKVRASTLDEAAAQKLALDYMAKHVPSRASPLCGNSICQDRRFLARWMPELEAYFHYRNLDVSTVKELVRRWKPDAMKGLVKQGRHEAYYDILESIEELRYYRRTVMTI